MKHDPKELIQRFMKRFDDRGDEECDNGCHCGECDECVEYNALIKDAKEYLGES